MKKSVRKLLATLLALCLLTAVLPMGAMVSAETTSMPVTTNLVTNGDFEYLDSSGEASYWHGGTFSATAAYNSNYGASVSGVGNVYQTIAVDQSCSYLLTFYAKVNNGGLTVSVIGNSTGELFISEKCVNSDWSLYSFIVSVGTADEDAQLSFRGASAETEFYVDDVMLILSGGAETTILANGSFETGNASGWSLNTGTAVTDEQAHSGTYSIKTTNTSTKYQAIGRQYFAVEPNTDYTITFWYMYVGDNAAPSFYTYAIGSSDKTSIAQTTTYPSAADTWVMVTLTFNSGSYEEVYLNLQNRTASDGGTYYFDDFVVTGGTSSGDDTEIPTNLITNSTFESGEVTPWQKFGASSAVPTVVSDYAHTGSYSLKVPFSVRQLSCGQDITVEANTDYIVSFYYMSADTSAGKNMWFGAYTTDTTSCTSSKNDLALNPVVLNYTTSEWTLATYTFNSGDNTTVRLSFSGTSSSNPTNNRYFLRVDDIVMVKQFTSFPEESIRGTYYTADKAYATINTQEFTAEAGKTYRISFSCRSMTNGFRLYVNQGESVSDTNFYSENERKWTNVSFVFRTNVSSLTLSLVNVGKGTLPTHFYITDYVIEEILDKEVNLLSHGGKSAMEMNDEGNVGGLAFLFSANIEDISYTPDDSQTEHLYTVYRYLSAIGHPYTNVQFPDDPYDYTVVRMGAIVSNKEGDVAATDLTVENAVAGSNTINIVGAKAMKEMCDDTHYVYGVRVTNIPESYFGRTIYARPYITVQAGERVITLYGEMVSASYNDYMGEVTK